MEYNFSEHQRWVNDNGDQTHRVDYQLDQDSIIVDAGGYNGNWSETIREKFGSNIYILEPLHSYYLGILDRFKNIEKIKVYNYGLSSSEGETTINLDNDSSSLFKPGKGSESVYTKTMDSFMGESNLERIDLIKINIEGSEYDLLEDIIDKNLHTKIKNIQVQFHVFIPNCEEKRRKIRESLSKTHECTYNYDFIWENWRIRE
jgi:FkbM family methyltransferase